ncbi:unnamed protein product, partial [Amoebophrya sp. A25]|eukprot:GSA25T00015284001.1
MLPVEAAFLSKARLPRSGPHVVAATRRFGAGGSIRDPFDKFLLRVLVDRRPIKVALICGETDPQRMQSTPESNGNNNSKFTTVLANSANEALSGTAFPYFPRGGFPANDRDFGLSRSNRWAYDWQKASHWCGMESGSGMLYPAQCVDGLVHAAGGDKLKRELAEAGDFLREEVRNRLDSEARTKKRGSILYSKIVEKQLQLQPSANACNFLREWVSAMTDGLASLRKQSKSGKEEQGKSGSAGIEAGVYGDVLCPPGCFIATTLPALQFLDDGVTVNLGAVLHFVAPFHDDLMLEERLARCYQSLLKRVLFNISGADRSIGLGEASQANRSALLSGIEKWNQGKLDRIREIRYVRLPLLGAGVRGIAVDDAARVAAESILSTTQALAPANEKNDTPLQEKKMCDLHFHVPEENDFRIVTNIFQEKFGSRKGIIEGNTLESLRSWQLTPYQTKKSLKGQDECTSR